MDLREKEFIQITGIVNLLTEENKYLRNYISVKNKYGCFKEIKMKKNRDIYKLLDTVGINDGESVHELKQHIHLLSEENKILMSHLEQLKVFFNFLVKLEKERKDKTLHLFPENSEILSFFLWMSKSIRKILKKHL